VTRVINGRFAVSFALLLLGVGLSASSFGLRFADLGGAFSPMFFPRIVLFFWVALATANLVADFMAQQPPAPLRLVRVTIIAAAALALALLMPHLGFFLTGAGFGLLTLWLLGVRDWRGLLLVGVGLPLAMAVLFSRVLRMPLPSSPFLWWL